MTDWVLQVDGVYLHGPPPIRSLYVPLTPGLRAFYGLNGAGKTRLIRAIVDVLSGEGAGFVVGRGVRTGRTRRFETLVQELRPDSAGLADPMEWAESVLSDLAPGIGELDELAAVTAANLVSQARGFGDAQLPLNALRELIEQHRFMLTPMPGSDRSSPTWAVSPAVAVDASTPALAEELARLNRIGMAFREKVPALSLDSEGDDWEAAEAAFMAIVEDEGTTILDGLFTSLSLFFDAVRDPDPETFLEELELLNRSAVVPYRVSGDLLDRLAVVQGRIAHIVRDDDLGIEGVHQLTKSTVQRGLGGREPLEVRDGEVHRSRQLASVVWQLQQEAQPLLDSLLVDAPEICVSVSVPGNWLFEDPLEWRARVAADRAVSLAELSEAQRRWALVTLALTLDRGPMSAHQTRLTFDDEPSLGEVDEELMRLSSGWAGWASRPPTIVSLDEPDGALHATAQRHAVEGLARLVDDRGCLVLCATHSREFLNHPQVELNHVTRDRTGSLDLKTLGDPASLGLAELGIDPADLFLLHRVIVLVEGSHDQTVVDGLVGDQLREARALVVPIRGGRLLATTVDSWVLSNFSDAPVVAVLDNLRADAIEAFWDCIVANSDRGQDRFDQIVRDHFSAKKRTEEQFVIDYCRTIADRGHTNRFFVFGLEKGDIPEYLPAAALHMPKPWEDLRAEFDAQSKHGSFKPWLKARYDVTIDDDSLARAIDEMDSIPAELVSLADFCTSLSRRPNRSAEEA